MPLVQEPRQLTSPGNTVKCWLAGWKTHRNPGDLSHTGRIRMPEQDEIVINVGDMLQRLTNNYLKSTTHRVVDPPRAEWHNPRLSIPFFLHPRSDMDLTCLPSCVTAGQPLAYPPITAGEYLNERLREIGLKK